MARRLRYVPTGQLMAISGRTIRGQYRLRPDAKTNDLVLGALGRALEEHGVALHAVSVQSGHYHLLASPRDAREMARFMHTFNRKVAYELNQRHQRRGAMWDGRYHAVLVSDEEEAQVGQLEYLLGQGCKDGLVASPRDWPGVQSSHHLLDGTELEGSWFHRDAYRRARLRGEEVSEDDCTTRYQVMLEPLPAWAHLDEATYRLRVGELIEKIEQETAAMHKRRGTRPLGVRKVLAASPFAYPRTLERTPQPLAHTASKEKSEEIRQGYRAYYEAYRQAAERLKAGELGVEFPPGSFPPALPFVAVG